MTAADAPSAADIYLRVVRVLAWARDGHAAFTGPQKQAWRAGYDQATRAALKALRPADDEVRP